MGSSRRSRSISTPSSGTAPRSNYTAYVGHTAVRLFVMGDEGYEREEPTAEELSQMADIVREAVAAGAAGFATSSAPTHSGDGGRPVPSRLASLPELETLVTPLHDLGRGVGAFTPGERIHHTDVYQLQHRIGRPFTWTALLTVQGSPFASSMAELSATERADGADVWPQVTCRPLTFRMTLAEPFTFNTVPSFASLMDRPVAERLAAYRDPQWRRTAETELSQGRVFRPRWDSVTDRREPRPSRARGSERRRRTPSRGGSGRSRRSWTWRCRRISRPGSATVLANDDEEMIARLLRQDGMLIGLSDAGAHVGQLCDACLADRPARQLGPRRGGPAAWRARSTS